MRGALQRDKSVSTRDGSDLNVQNDVSKWDKERGGLREEMGSINVLETLTNICSVAKTFAISGCLCKLLVAVQETWEGRSSDQIPMAGKSRDLQTLNFERLTKENQLTGLLHRVEMATEILERDQ
ncbi:hypothetical protein DKX38_014919 [Salix brachista]|uniref:Uncharacterized protein n=1 Tax=Salix brachista TaxID=2182728 RepID=A0A5N5L5R2_9ROSI|nr:hypothetical protein DKX38_014919 [Salix brachista]